MTAAFGLRTRHLTCLLILAAFVVSAMAGSPSAAAAGPIAKASDMDCADFPNQQAAQNYYISRGGPSADPDGLDGDNDGRACDSLPCPCSGSSGPAPPYTPPYIPPADPAPPEKRAKTFRARIIKVIDGDTIKVKLTSGAKRTVRLLGVNTPETKSGPVACGGPQATDSMVRLGFRKSKDTNGDGLRDKGRGLGRKVTLRTDPTQATKDRYGRLLAYARTSVDLQAAQLRRGWAAVYIYANKPFQRTGQYQAVEAGAKAATRGVWGVCGGNFQSAS